MFRRSPRAAMLWLAALIVAALTAFTVIASVSSLRHQDQAFGAIHSVLVARHDLPVGTPVTTTDLSTKKIRGESPQPDTMTRTQDAVGLIVRAPMLAGDLVTARHLAARTRGEMSNVVPNGSRAVRLVVEHAVRPAVGDVVDVLATFDPATLADGGDPTVVVAPGVTVVAVDSTAASGDSVGITVLVTPAQASRLAFSASTGTITIALAPPEAARAAQATR